MKFFVMSLLALSLGFAQDCINEICVGKCVIDGSDDIGLVKQIKDNIVSYKTSYTVKTSNYLKLSAEVLSKNGLKSNIHAVTEKDDVGQVLRVFENGKAQIKLSYGTYVKSNLSPEVASKDGLSSSIYAVTGGDDVGQVLRVFENGKAQIKLSYGTYVKSNLSPEVASKDGLSSSIYAVTGGDDVGQVLRVFENGKVQIKLSYGTYIKSNLSPEVPFLESEPGIKKGVNAISPRKDVGVIQKVFRNGKAQIKLSYGTYVKSKLSPETEVLPSDKDIKKDVIVLTGRDDVGKVLKTFKNGQVQVKLSYGTYIKENLSPQTDLLLQDEDIKPGVIAITKGDDVGKVLKTFRNGKSQIKLSYGTYIKEGLNPEVETHPTYNKGELYATSSYSAGKAIRFFRNEKVQIEGFGESSVSDTLFLHVESLEGLQKDDLVVDSATKEGTLKHIFENGTVVYTSDKLDLMGKVFDSSDEDKVQRLIQLDQVLNRGFQHSSAAYSIVKKDNLQEVNKELLAFLKESDNRHIKRISTKERKKIIEYLSEGLEIQEEDVDTNSDSNNTTDEANDDVPYIASVPHFQIVVNKKKYRDDLTNALAGRKLTYSIEKEIKTGNPSIQLTVKRRSCSLNLTYENTSYKRENKAQRNTVLKLCLKDLESILNELKL